MTQARPGQDPAPRALQRLRRVVRDLVRHPQRVFGDVRPGEGTLVLLMFLNIFLLLVSYYIIKTVREPLILLGGGAEAKSYAGAAQALTLVLYVPIYGWVASRLPRLKLIVAVVLFSSPRSRSSGPTRTTSTAGPRASGSSP